MKLHHCVFDFRNKKCSIYKQRQAQFSIIIFIRTVNLQWHINIIYHNFHDYLM